MNETKRTPLWQWSACDLAAAIAAREISCEVVVGSALERMRSTNASINAVVDDLGDEAMRLALARDKAVREGAALGPLHGVPVTIKENIDQKNRATTNGVAAFANVIAADDAPVVRNLLLAGAVPIGRTNTPEFSFRATTDNELHGRTFNPWNDTASAGGSSGGAAAGVMMGYGALAHGNDIGGSLRFPAYACGAATVKPGLGRVPAFNPSASAERGILAQLMSVQGLIAREVRDVRVGMQALLRYDALDPWMVPMPFRGAPIGAPIKVALTKNMHEFALHPAVEHALDSARESLQGAGYEVVEVEPPLLREAADVGVRCLFGETKAMLGADIDKYGSATVQGIFAEYERQFQPYHGHDLLRAMAERARFVRAWNVFLEQWPLVLTPFLPKPIFRWDRDTQGAEGVREVLGCAIYSYSMNFMGLPAGNVPAAMHEGHPVGVQIVAQRFREDLILDALEVIESQAGVMAPRLWKHRGD